MTCPETGGGSGIRTHGTLARTTVFETAPFDHSGTPPRSARKPLASGFGPRAAPIYAEAAPSATAAAATLRSYSEKSPVPRTWRSIHAVKASRERAMASHAS